MFLIVWKEMWETDEGGFMLLPWLFKKDDFSSIAICSLLRRAEGFWLINDLVQQGWAVHIVYLADSPFCSCVCAQLLQLCPTLCDSMDCSPPGSSVYGILQARIWEWVAMPSSRESSWPRDRTHVFMSPALVGGFPTTEEPGKSYVGSFCWIMWDLSLRCMDSWVYLWV